MTPVTEAEREVTWFKVDDGLHGHKKTARAGVAAMGLWVIAGSWSADNLTDGFVPDYMAARMDPDFRDHAAALVRAGYWSEGEDPEGDKGWRFLHWAEYQPMKADVEAREGAEKAGASWGNHKRWHVNTGRSNPDCEHCSAGRRPPESPPSRPPDSGASRPPDRVPESPPNPPTRPVPTREETTNPSGSGASRRAPRSSARNTDALPGMEGQEIAPTGEATAQVIVGEWLDRCSTRPPGQVIGQVSKHIKALLAEGYEPDLVRRSVAEWKAKGLHPSTLPSVLNEMANAGGATARARRSDSTLLSVAMDLTAELLAEENDRHPSAPLAIEADWGAPADLWNTGGH